MDIGYPHHSDPPARHAEPDPVDPLWAEHGFALTARQVGIALALTLLACAAGTLLG
jgi:hypothetical protein